MALAKWKDLCLDTGDIAGATAFWAPVLGLRPDPPDDGPMALRGPTPQHALWLNPVPEPKSVKNRVHLDLVRADLAPLVELGARVVAEVEQGARHWSVLTDPQGNELCVFDEASGSPSALVIDSAEPVTAARWWADVFDARRAPGPDGAPRWLADVPGLPFDVVKFVGVDDPRAVKNRMHWDVSCDDVKGLVSRGARVLREPGGDIDWFVLADPEGNEFCVFGT